MKRITNHLHGIMALALLASPGLAQFGVENVAGPLPVEEMPATLRMDYSLFEAERVSKLEMDKQTPLASLQAILERKGLRMREDGKVLVEIVMPRGEAPVGSEWLAGHGVDVGGVWRHRVKAWVPARKLVDVAAALPLAARMENVGNFRPDGVGKEGTADMNVINYQKFGADGSGRKIAVIDGGFQDFSGARANGDFPPASQTTFINYTNRDIDAPKDGDHGTNCVEVAYDNCPGANFRIYKIESLGDVGRAVDDAIENGVDVISHSLSWYNEGWDDNDGDACKAAEDASNAGILFFTSAGNTAQEEHWQGSFRDADGDGRHEWSGSDEFNGLIIPPGDSVTIYLQWEGSGGTFNYNIYLYDSDQTTVLAQSASAFGSKESFTWTNTGGTTKSANLVVTRPAQGTTTFEVFVGRNSAPGNTITLQYETAANSTTSPSNSTAANVISVGAVDEALYSSAPGATGIIESFSSHGPSNSGMTLPDLVGPDNTTTFRSPTGFSGTSGSTPNAAGAATAFWSADTLLTGSAVRWIILELAAALKDWGADGADNIYGRGGLQLWDYADNTLWVARNYGNVLNSRSAPFFTMQAAHNAAVSGGRLVILPGGSYPEPVTFTKAMTIETVGAPTNLGF